MRKEQFKKISKRQFEELCKIQCTEEEICSVLEVDEQTLINWCKRTYNKTFSKVFQDKRKGGKASLRRRQWNLSEKNASMAIWLGKQYLGQKDETRLDTMLRINDDELTKSLIELAQKL